jgi:predicted AAA+ superfamily ATPase
MDISRSFWQKKIELAWERAPIVWLSGVRRSGKTTFVESLNDTAYFNCDLRSVQEDVADPESFFKKTKRKFLCLMRFISFQKQVCF